MHVPQSYQAEIELKNLMAVNKLIVTGQTNSPVMGIVQDSLNGTYLITRKNIWLKKDMVCQCLMRINRWKIPIPAILKPEPLWSGCQLFSQLFPPTFQYVSKSAIIRGGELVCGPLTKKHVGRSDGNIIHELYLSYGSERTADFFHECQQLVDFWLTSVGFSTGIGDCVIEQTEIDDILKPISTMNTTRRSEIDINHSLNRMRDQVGTIIQKKLPFKHGMKNMVDSGSKGSMVNICQIAGCVGQQNVQGKRIPWRFQDRTLPHFSKCDNSPKACGFIQNSYYKGLTPTEFFFHAMAGREGIIVRSYIAVCYLLCSLTGVFFVRILPVKRQLRDIQNGNWSNV